MLGQESWTHPMDMVHLRPSLLTSAAPMMTPGMAIEPSRSCHSAVLLIVPSVTDDRIVAEKMPCGRVQMTGTWRSRVRTLGNVTKSDAPVSARKRGSRGWLTIEEPSAGVQDLSGETSREWHETHAPAVPMTSFQ